MSDPVTEPISATFLGIREEDTMDGLSIGALNALKRGSVSVSMGPLPQLSVIAPDGKRTELGDLLVRSHDSERMLEIEAGVDFSARAGHWERPDQKLKMKLVSNLGELAVVELTREHPRLNRSIDLTGVSWLRGELYGVFCNAHTMVGFTNAIYFR